MEHSPSLGKKKKALEARHRERERERVRREARPSADERPPLKQQEASEKRQKIKERLGPEAPAREVPGPCDRTLAGERAHTSLRQSYVRLQYTAHQGTRAQRDLPSKGTRGDRCSECHIAGRTEQRSSKDAGGSEGEALSPY